jgi:hypothetical protein
MDNEAQKPKKKLKFDHNSPRPASCLEECKYVIKSDGHVKLQHGSQCAKIVKKPDEHVNLQHGSQRAKIVKKPDEHVNLQHGSQRAEIVKNSSTSVQVEEKTFQCSFCKDSFSSERQRQTHVISKHHTPISSFKCTYCTHCFTSEEYRDNHIKMKHNPSNRPKGKTHKCPFCILGFSSQGHRDNHVEMKHPLMFCSACKFATRSTKDLRQHRWSHFRCKVCYMTFSDLQKLEDHIKTYVHKKSHYKSQEKAVSSQDVATANVLFHCPTCSKGFTEISKLERHIESSHTNVDKMCPFCKLTFTEESLLVSHYQLVHQIDDLDTNFRCSACSAKFACRMDLNNHMDKLHPLVKCHHCSLSFRSIKVVKSHMLIVHKKNSYFCSCCMLGFQSQALLDNHIEESHSQSETGAPENLLIPCSVCSSKFSSRREVNEHIGQFHPLLRCPICPLSFRCQFSSTFYECLFCTKELCTAFLELQFGFVIFFGARILAQKLLIKC